MVQEKTRSNHKAISQKSQVVTSRIVIKPAADRDLDRFLEYLASDSPATASRFLEAFRATLDDLIGTPGMGQLNVFRHRLLVGVRVWRVRGFKNHLIFCRETTDGIEVVRVLHGARDVPSAFNEN